MPLGLFLLIACLQETNLILKKFFIYRPGLIFSSLLLLRLRYTAE